nr:aldose epimerase family protein [Sphingomonas jinjuensis]
MVGDGIAVRLTDLGVTMLAIVAPDRVGALANVLVGPEWPELHPAGGAPGPDARMGATCGRVANRIGGAAYTIDGVHYPLVANEGDNQLHGGPLGFDKRLWTIERADATAAVMTLVGEDGDQGHPGRLSVRATFVVERATLSIRYEATTDRPTHVNLVAHPYFNLSGSGGSALDHRLSIAADDYLPIGAAQLPTGAVVPVAGTPFDYREARAVGSLIGGADEQLRIGDGYNHNFALRGQGLRDVAVLVDPASGRRLTIASDAPGLQFYSGNALGDGYVRRSALCLETQGWPDAANRPGFPSTRLDPGETYRAETRFTLDIVG